MAERWVILGKWRNESPTIWTDNDLTSSSGSFHPDRQRHPSALCQMGDQDCKRHAPGRKILGSAPRGRREGLDAVTNAQVDVAKEMGLAASGQRSEDLVGEAPQTQRTWFRVRCLQPILLHRHQELLPLLIRQGDLLGEAAKVEGDVTALGPVRCLESMQEEQKRSSKL